MEGLEVIQLVLEIRSTREKINKTTFKAKG